MSSSGLVFVEIVSLPFGEAELMETALLIAFCFKHSIVASLRGSGINGNNLMYKLCSSQAQSLPFGEAELMETCIFLLEPVSQPSRFPSGKRN